MFTCRLSSAALVVPLFLALSAQPACNPDLALPLDVGDVGHDASVGEDADCVPPPPGVFDPPPAGESIADACARLVEARRAWESRFLLPVATIDRQGMIDSCVGIATLPGSLVTPADIEACVASLEPSCHHVWNWYPSCLGYGWGLLSGNLKGTRAAGVACRAHLQCASGMCTGAFDSCGVCKNRREVGEACDPRVDECNPRSSCAMGRCLLGGKTLGEPCTHKWTECQPTLYCGSHDVCTAHVVEGGACDMPDACDLGLFCRLGVCAGFLKDGAPCANPALDHCVGVCDAGVCRAPRTGLGLGEDCTLGDRCLEELSCEMGVCIRKSWPMKGERCGGACSPPLTCDPNDVLIPTEFTCVDRPRAGEPCTTYGQCEPDAECVGFAPATKQRGNCVRLGHEGDPCPCGGTLLCQAGVCVAYGAAFDCKP